ncbi:MAG TPA: hypothetical protein VLB73_04000 [Patescibacteria group bacterium]|nr:hypothetical protein [Patescibacteria group bacterium]
MRRPGGKEGEMGQRPTAAEEKNAKSALNPAKGGVTRRPGWLAKLFGPKATWIGSNTK